MDQLNMPAYFGREWYSNMGDKRQSVYFTYERNIFLRSLL